MLIRKTVSSNFYRKMVEWYWLANNKSKASDAAQKAVEALKSENESKVAVLQSWLKQYK